jgi:hypothetical protein
MNKTRSLPETAPGLFSSLVKMFTPNELSNIEKNYEEVVSRGGAEEFPILREVDASFNPRPARIAAIVLADARPKDPARAILLGFWSCLITEGVVSTLESVVPEGLYSSLLRINPSDYKANGDIDEVIVALAVRLDQVRHLHMTALSPTHKSAILQDAEDMALLLVSSHPELPLLQRLTHAIHQQRRILGERE